MKNRIVFLLLSIVFVSLLFSPNAFSEETVVRVASYPKIRDADPSIVDIVIENGQNVAGYQVMLQFDADYLEYAGIQHGDYLPKDAFFGEEQIIDDVDPMDDSLKAILFAAASFTNESNDYGILATLTFNRVKSGSSDLTLLTPGTLLSNKAGELLYPRLEHSKTYLEGVPNLVVDSVQARPIRTEEARQNYSKAEEFELRATVMNKGNVKSAATNLIFYGPASTETEKGGELGETTIAKLDPNRAIDISLPDLVAAPEISGTYYYTVCLGNNNTKCSKIEITVEELPDLVVEPVTVNKTTLGPGDTFTLTATLKNQGFGRVEAPIYYRCHRSTHPNIHNMTGSDRVSTGASEEIGTTRKAVIWLKRFGESVDVMLTANQSSTHSIVLTAREEPGTYYYHVCVESPLPESNPDNNCSADVEITVEAPDLVAQNIWISMPFDPEERETITLDPGDTFFLNFRYKNEGPATEETSVQYYQSTNKTISKTDTPFLVGTSKLLSSNETKHSWSDIKVPQNPGTYYYGAYVGSVGDEIDTDNNWSEVVTVTVRGKGLKIPGGLITDVAFTPNHTYFVLNPQFVSDNGGMEDKLRQQCTVTLLLEALHRDVATDSETWDYYALPLPPKIRRTADEQAIDQLSGVVFQELISKVPLLSLASGNDEANKKKVSVGDILKWGNIIFGFTEVSENEDPRATITYYPNSEDATSYEGDIYPILFMIQNKRLSSVGFKVEQIYYTSGSWVPIKLDFTIKEPPKHFYFSPVFIIAKALEFVGLEEPLKFVEAFTVQSVNFALNIISTAIEALNNQFFGDHFTVEYKGEWNLEETFQKENPGFGAPSTRLRSLADYPPFQQLSPEVQAYLLLYFKGFTNTGAINPEAWQTPEKTTLLPNYPNPFNPETWIPYQLASPADVTLTIYDIKGRVVRDLDLGHQRAGTYHGRSRAAYWDGKNAVGESVASGLYFYTLKAGDFTATRKMLIRK